MKSSSTGAPASGRAVSAPNEATEHVVDPPVLVLSWWRAASAADWDSLPVAESEELFALDLTRAARPLLVRVQVGTRRLGRLLLAKVEACAFWTLDVALPNLKALATMFAQWDAVKHETATRCWWRAEWSPLALWGGLETTTAWVCQSRWEYNLLTERLRLGVGWGLNFGNIAFSIPISSFSGWIHRWHRLNPQSFAGSGSMWLMYVNEFSHKWLLRKSECMELHGGGRIGWMLIAACGSRMTEGFKERRRFPSSQLHPLREE